MAIRAGVRSGRSIRVQSSNPYHKIGRSSTAGSSDGTGRRVYVGNLSYDVSWQDLKDHFKSAGRVIHADVLEESSGRSKGCGIVEFSSKREAQIAMETLNDSSLKGRPIFVREDREERKSGKAADDVVHRGQKQFHDSQNSACRVFVGNLSFDTSWQDLKDHFRRAGNVTRADILEGNDGRSKGCGIVEFQTIAEADAAIAELNDTSLGGRQIFVREDRGGDGKASGAAGSRVSAATNIGSTTRTVPRLDAALPSQRDGSGGAARPSGHAESRSVYVGNLSYSVTWQDLKDHFKKAGNVIRADVMEEAGGRSKGCGLVEFSSVEEAQSAIDTLNDTELKGRLIFVREDREKDKGKEEHGTTRARSSNPPLGSAISRRQDGSASSAQGCKLYVGNLAWDVTWRELKDHFKSAGEVVHADVIMEPNGRSKGFGIVEMATSSDADEAIATLNNSRIGGRQIYVREDREER